MALIGYIRVSTQEQNEGRQVEALECLGIEKCFLDKCSGKDAARPQLQAMREYVREGDTIIVAEYSRLARSVRDLLSIVDELTSKGVQLRSLKEQFDTSTPQGKFLLTVFAGLAEFEREMILERQRDSTPESWEAASVSELERDLCAELSQHFSQNNADIVFDRLQGLSEKKTAEKHGVKKEEVQAIYAHAKKVLRKSPLLQRYLSA